MEFLYIIVLIAIIGYVFRDQIEEVLEDLKSKQKDKIDLPYKRRKYLMNIPEKKFFKKLNAVMPDGYVAFPQISLNAILDTKSSDEYMKYQNKINRKIVDFVVFKEPKYIPQLIREYDGKNHKRKDRRKRDEFLDKALKSAGLEIIHFSHRKNFSEEDVGKSLQETELFSIKEDN